jgi:hypothetical protein
MPIYNSKDNDILAALEETYRAMLSEKPLNDAIADDGRARMGRDDGEGWRAHGDGSADTAPVDRRPAGHKEQDRIARRAKHKAPETKRETKSMRDIGKARGKDTALRSYKFVMDRSTKKGKTQTEKGPKIPNTIKKKK